MKTMGIRVIVILSISFTSFLALAENVVYRKTQRIDFAGSDVDGKVRSPDGAFLHQKRAVKFLPLYKVKKNFNRNLRETMEYLR